MNQRREKIILLGLSLLVIVLAGSVQISFSQSGVANQESQGKEWNIYSPFLLKNASWSAIATCMDSDKGLNYGAAGYVTSSDLQGGYHKFDDACGTGSDTGYLLEQYCDNKTPATSRYFCTYGCADGACLAWSEVCTDSDGDGFAVEGGACGQVDCNDINKNAYPGAKEICNNGTDDNCNSLIDQADPSCQIQSSCSDSDGGLSFEAAGQVEGTGELGNPFLRKDACGVDEFDGYLNEQYCKGDQPWIAQQFCEYGCKDGACISQAGACTDADGDGYAATGGRCGLKDCDDADPGRNPGELEDCGNGVDDDCDNLVDAEDLDCQAGLSCTDSDGGLNFKVFGTIEGTGPNGSYTFSDACGTGDREGWVSERYCSGAANSAYPFNCDFGCAGGKCSEWSEACTDLDGDGYATDGGRCGAVDCKDTNSGINPGAPEACSNNIDDNCNGYLDTLDLDCLTCTDQDGDGYATNGGLCGPVDCNDQAPGVYPNALENCSNGIDDNCNGAVDLEEPRCSLNTPLNTIVIGWDGTQRDHFWECYNKQLPECPNGLPNIKALTGGVIFNSTTTNGETSTKPGWAQMFTGYDAEVTGVYNLFDYQPIPEGYSVFEKIENQFGAGNVVTMFVSAKSTHTGGACPGDPTYDNNGNPVIEVNGQPWCLAKNHLDYFELDKVENDKIGNRALELLDAHQNDLFFGLFIFANPDRMGHLMGENSVDYSQQLIEVDEWLGRIVAKLVDLGIYDETLVYVVTDHGFGEKPIEGEPPPYGSIDHLNAPYGIFAGNDPLLFRSGDRKDPAATFLERYGIGREAVGGAPALDGYSLFSLPPLACIPEGEAYVDYENAPYCCAGLQLIDFDLSYGVSCVPDTGGANENSGYCTACGNGVCEAPENKCNCSTDCQ